MFQTQATKISTALVAALLLASVPSHAQGSTPPPASSAPPAAMETTPAPVAPVTPAPVGDAPVTPTDEPVVPDAPAVGTLTISSSPAGMIFIDGKETGKTTPVEELVVPAGQHTLRIVDPGTGREATSEITLDAGGTLNLNLNLPEAKPVDAAGKAGEKSADGTPAASVPGLESMPWTWMTIAGWTGLGLGTIGLLAGAVVLTSETDAPDRQALGFGLFGTGAGLVLGGGVLLYLDDELADATAAGHGAPAAAATSAK